MNPNLVSNQILPIIITMLLILGFLGSRTSYGYIDPGAGHLLLQALGVVFFGALFYVKQVVNFFKRLFSRSK